MSLFWAAKQASPNPGANPTAKSHRCTRAQAGNLAVPRSCWYTRQTCSSKFITHSCRRRISGMLPLGRQQRHTDGFEAWKQTRCPLALPTLMQMTCKATPHMQTCTAEQSNHTIIIIG